MMPFPRVAACTATIFWFASVALPSEAVEKKTDEKTGAALTVHLTPDGRDEGFCLYYPRQISASSARPVKFPVLVVNLLKREVFLEVEGHDDPSFALENDDKGQPLLMGGSVVGLPDNANRLKRLHACDYKDGKPHPCGCATAYIDAKIDFPKEVELNNYVGTKVTIGVSLVGYYRANGNKFEKTANLPVEVVK
jgi:hypothetical protein